MKHSLFSEQVAALRELLSGAEALLSAYKRDTGKKILGIRCDILPVEILAAYGTAPLRIPGADLSCCDCGTEPSAVYDFVIQPRGCACASETGGRVRIFPVHAGYGSEHGVAMHLALNGLLGDMGFDITNGPSAETLALASEEYDALRRSVRQICTARNRNPALLSQDDLRTVFTAALCLPPATVLDLLRRLAASLSQTVPEESPRMISALAHFCGGLPPGLLDSLEESGVLVAEDDSCLGRRSFDLSFNPQSPDLYYEILDACSYKPMCPSVRPLEERYELLYKLIGSHGIELVIFIEDACCESRLRDIGELRVRLMRTGVDPLVVTTADAVEKVRDYVEKAAR